jgi:hypothetical protein
VVAARPRSAVAMPPRCRQRRTPCSRRTRRSGSGAQRDRLSPPAWNPCEAWYPIAGAVPGFVQPDVCAARAVDTVQRSSRASPRKRLLVMAIACWAWSAEHPGAHRQQLRRTEGAALRQTCPPDDAANRPLTGALDTARRPRTASRRRLVIPMAVSRSAPQTWRRSQAKRAGARSTHLSAAIVTLADAAARGPRSAPSGPAAPPRSTSIRRRRTGP